MPVPAPPAPPVEAARVLGGALRARRKALGISSAAAAEAAGISRVTWHRLEKGEGSVALRSFLDAARVLGLHAVLDDGSISAATEAMPPDAWLPLHIRLDDYPQLRRLAWQVGDGAQVLSPREALGLYERNWRHLPTDRLEAREKALIDALRQAFGPKSLPDV